jgi:hypothetical protein
METNKIVLTAGLIFILFLIIHNAKIGSSTTTTTKSTTVYRKPVTPIAGPNPHYNSYKSQYYN